MNNLCKASAGALLLGLLSFNSYAQDDNAPVIRKDENIIIHKNGTSTEKLTIVIDSNKVTVNGKPVDEFKDGDVTILRDGDNNDMMPKIAELMPRGGVQMFNSDMMPMNSNHAFLGVMTEKSDDGAKIENVTKESPADKAGLKEGDVITKVGDTKVADADDLYKAVGQYKAGDKTNITYLRDGKENAVAVTLEKNQNQVFAFNNNRDFKMFAPDMRGMKNFSFNINMKPRLGLQVQDTEDGNGVKVLDVDDDSPAAKAGLKEDDIITQANGKDIKSVDDLKTDTKDLKDGDSIILQYKRDNKIQTADVKIPKELKTTDL